MGRIVRSFTVAATVLPALSVYDAVGNTVLAVVSCLLSILILLVLLPYLSNAAVSFKPTEELISESPELSPSGADEPVCAALFSDTSGNRSIGKVADHRGRRTGNRRQPVYLLPDAAAIYRLYL